MKSSEKRGYTVWDYLWYALYAFAGLGLEIVLLSFIEPMFLGKASEYGTRQNIIHWILTIICWAVIIVFLIQGSQKKLDYNIMNNIFLIVVFGQKFIETLLKRKSNIPFGGIILCCTWGAIHILTQGSIVAGLGVMAFAIMYGIMYLALNRNTKASFLAMLFAFII